MKTGLTCPLRAYEFIARLGIFIHMYSIVARLKNQPAVEDRDAYIVSAVALIAKLAKRLSAQNAHFADLGLILKDTQSYINAKVESYAAEDDGVPPEVIEEFDRLSQSNRILLRDDPEMVAQMLQHSAAALQEQAGGDHLSLSVQSPKLLASAKISLTRGMTQSTGSLAITLPAEHEEDFWFDNLSMMKELIREITNLYPVSWLSIGPTLYGTSLAPSLFEDREAFGWLGYTDQPVATTGEALAEVTSVEGGSILVLKPNFMTLHAADIELCHKAEAHLVDLGVLPLK